MTTRVARWIPVALAAALAVSGTAGRVFALDLSVQGARSASQGMAVPGVTQLDLENYRSIQGRENFQLEQRLNRQADRQMNLQPTPQPQVPVVKPTCQRDIDGNSQTRGCR